MIKWGLIFATALTFSGAASAQVVYSNNFETPATTSGGTVGVLSGGGGVVGSQSLPGTGSFIYQNDTGGDAGNGGGRGVSGQLTTLTLSNLPAHDAIDFDFLLALIDSWDSRDGVGGVTPDNLNIYIDGVLIGSLTAANTSGSINDFAGGSQTGVGNFGFSSYTDRTVDMSGSSILSFNHTASSIVLGLQAAGAGWQGGTDESWGIDNIVVSIRSVNGAVPEPSTWAMMLLGFGAIGLSVRRRSTFAQVA